MVIALLGDPDDLAIAYLSWLSGQRGIEWLLLPEATLGVGWTFSLYDDLGGGDLDIGERRLSLSDLDGIFVRFRPDPPLPGALALDPIAHGVFTHERREGLHHLLHVVRCPVVNRPWSGRANASKPLQMLELRAAGFTVPHWVATNDPHAAAEFASACPHGVIYKASSGLRSRVRRLDEELTARLTRGTSPTVLQEYVAGRDVRVHTVGGRAFATEMISGGVDYRFDAVAEYRSAVVDPDIAQRCCATAAAEGLLLAGFDFRVAADGVWHCLEMNPVPSFLPYEMCSGEPIGHAVLDLFVEPARHRERSQNLHPHEAPKPHGYAYTGRQSVCPPSTGSS